MFSRATLKPMGEQYPGGNKKKVYQSPSQYYRYQIYPTVLFCNFRASKLGDRGFILDSKTSNDEFWGTNLRKSQSGKCPFLCWWVSLLEFRGARHPFILSKICFVAGNYSRMSEAWIASQIECAYSLQARPNLFVLRELRNQVTDLILCSSETWLDKFWGFEIAKRLVGKAGRAIISCWVTSSHPLRKKMSVSTYVCLCVRVMMFWDRGGGGGGV